MLYYYILLYYNNQLNYLFMKKLKKLPLILSILSLISFITPVNADVKNVNIDKIDNIKGSFLIFFIIISNLISCYNITVCNNITFTSQDINELKYKYISRTK